MAALTKSNVRMNQLPSWENITVKYHGLRLFVWYASKVLFMHLSLDPSSKAGSYTVLLGLVLFPRSCPTHALKLEVKHGCPWRQMDHKWKVLISSLIPKLYFCNLPVKGTLQNSLPKQPAHCLHCMFQNIISSRICGMRHGLPLVSANDNLSLNLMFIPCRYISGSNSANAYSL